MVKVGINGFGRIGRNVLRAALGNPDMQIVAINDLTDSKTLAHLLKHDSLLGTLAAEVSADEGRLVVDGKPIRVFSERDPANIPWRQEQVDIVIEATGFFTERDKAAVHIHSGGAKRVIISAPGKNEDLTIVMGVNDGLYSPDKHVVVSNGSCTTNGLAPAAQVLHQHFGIKHGLMNTTHAYTNSQALHDQPEKDLRGARAAALSIVPYSSGAAKALGKVIPELDGRLTGYSLRVPVPVVSIKASGSADASPAPITQARIQFSHAATFRPNIHAKDTLFCSPARCIATPNVSSVSSRPLTIFCNVVCSRK